MAGLDDINPTDPAGTETPTLGDNRIRALAAKTIEAFALEHALAGEHTFLIGSAAQRPAAGHAGRFFILTAAGVAVELQYDTGSAWVTLTSNQAIIDQDGDLATHIAANPIDHPDDSVTAAKILAGAILAKHLDATSGNASIAALVNGSNADAFHVHASTDQNIAKFTSSATWTCPAGITLVEFQGWGSGGGGGYCNGSGGGGGGYNAEMIAVVPGTDYTVTVGLGGTGGTSGSGGTGGQTSMSGAIAYGGGGGGDNVTPGIGGLWSSGRGCIGTGGKTNASYGGGGQAGGCGGKGADGRTSTGSGYTGSAPGGGGGADRGCSGIGGNGARGLVILKW